MADDFVKQLTDAAPGFRPEPFYNEACDCVDYQIVDDAIVANYIDPLITLHRSATDRRVIGFQTKGVTGPLESIGAEVAAIGTGEAEDATIKGVVVLLAALQTSRGKATKDQVNALSSLFGPDLQKEIPIERAA